MTISDWTPAACIDEIKRLTNDGILGFYSQVEATELIAFPPGTGQPINLFTLLVAEERSADQVIEAVFLNSSRITVPGLRDWSFGVCRYTLPLEQLVPAFKRVMTTGVWDASGSELLQNALSARPSQFVPPDSLQAIPWNSVLKNNFWNGSYVIELADTKKVDLGIFLTAPHLLQTLSEAIQSYVPIRLASLSDRLGNIALQLPITILMAVFNGLQDGNMSVEVGWHPEARPRHLRASVELEFDKTMTGYNSVPVVDEQTLLSLPSGPGSHRGILWDDANGLILAATGESIFIDTVAMNIRPISPEPRVFMLPNTDGAAQSHRVSVHSRFSSLVESPRKDGSWEWTRHRIYRDETSKLARERHFIQYRPQSGGQAAEHEKALKDIRYLITRYGEGGAWLWDPYLSALDILKTLFFSPHSGADLRGLTARKEPPELASQADDYFQRQRDVFENAKSNYHGMRLEYRARMGHRGWDFHDRFLIFPQKERGALAWSLGTSLNSVGKAHHILQRVDGGQQVMDAFVELWDQLDGPEHLIWKVPTR